MMDLAGLSMPSVAWKDRAFSAGNEGDEDESPPFQEALESEEEESPRGSSGAASSRLPTRRRGRPLEQSVSRAAESLVEETNRHSSAHSGAVGSDGSQPVGRALSSSSSSDSDSDDDSGRVVKLVMPAQARAAARARAAGAAAATPKQPSIDRLSDQAAQTVELADPGAPIPRLTMPEAAGVSMTSAQRNVPMESPLQPSSHHDEREQAKRARKRPNAFVAEPASGSGKTAKTVKKRARVQKHQHDARAGQQLNDTAVSEATLAKLRREYFLAVGRHARGNFARDPDWLRHKIAEAELGPSIPAPAAPVAAPTKADASLLSRSPPRSASATADAENDKRELRDWLFVRRIGSSADALIDQGFSSLDDLIEAGLTKEDLEDECFRFTMYVRKRLLRELEHESKSRSAAVAVGSPPISRPEEHTALDTGCTLIESQQDEEPDPEDMVLSESDDEDDDEKNIYDAVDSIAPPVQSVDGSEKEKERTRSPEEYISRRLVSESSTKDKQPRRTLPPLDLRKQVPGGPPPSAWEHVASTGLFSAFWELSVHDLDPEIPDTPGGEERVRMRKQRAVSNFNAQSREWVRDVPLDKFVKMFLDYCTLPRAKYSDVPEEDARYCCAFVARLQQAKALRFSLVSYMDILVKTFPAAVDNSDGSEKQVLGLAQLISETLKNVNRWRTRPDAFSEECCSLECSTTHEKFVKLSSSWHSLLVSKLVKELALTSTEQQRRVTQRCYMLALQKLLRWLSLTQKDHSRLDKHLQQLEKVGRRPCMALAMQLRRQLPQPKREAGKTSGHSPRDPKPVEPISKLTLTSRLVSFYRQAYAGRKSVPLDEFLKAFYKKDTVAESEMQVLHGSYPQPAKFLSEACGGQFEVTGHGVNVHVGLAQAENVTCDSVSAHFQKIQPHSKVIKTDDKLHGRLVTVFWRNFGTKKVSCTLFFKAIKECDSGAKAQLGKHGMKYLVGHCREIFEIQDRGSGETSPKFTPLLKHTLSPCQILH